MRQGFKDMKMTNPIPHQKQRGAALIVSLMMLLVMTIIGVSSMQTNILEEKMANNNRDISLSLQSAEAAQREAEAYIETIVSPAAAFDGTTHWLYPDNSDPDVYAEATWNTARSYQGGDITNVTTRPKYIIELIGTIGSATTDVNINGYGESSGSGDVNSFRITTRGTGKSNDTVTMIQTYYARRF